MKNLPTRQLLPSWETISLLGYIRVGTCAGERMFHAQPVERHILFPYVFLVMSQTSDSPKLRTKIRKF